MKQINLLSEDNRLDRLSKIGDPLEKVASAALHVTLAKQALR